MKKIIYPLTAIIIIIADRISKHAVISNMEPGDRIPLIGDFLSINYVQNTGTAFSMFEGNRLVTIFLTSVLIIACIVYIVKEIKSGRKATPLLLTCIAAGGISNISDRLTLGFVIDMISCGKFAVFNIADMFITCGCIALMIYIFVMYKKGEDV